MLKLTKFHISQSIVFLLTFFAYALLHANRKSFSNVKPTLKNVWTGVVNNQTQLHPSDLWHRSNLFQSADSAELFLGALDTIFMAFYAIGLFFIGYIGDRFDPRFVLGFGMISSSILLFFFGVVSEWLHFYNVYYYGVLYALNGLCQSAGWPATVTIMSNWFGHARGFWLGLWSGCACVGNIIGDLLTGTVLDYGYQYGFLVPAAVLFAFGFIIIFGIITRPEDLSSSNNATNRYQIIQEIDDSSPSGDEGFPPFVSETSTPPKPNHVGLWSIITIPGVIPYSLAYACLKLVNYAFFFWLAEYLSSNFNWSNALSDKISIWYDVGGIIGGIVTGIISDLMWSRSPVTVASLVLTIPALVAYRRVGGDVVTNAVYLAITGVVIGGPATLISSAISADLGSQPLLSGNAAALSTVTGIIDGTGSVGAALGQVFVPKISQAYGWQAVFIFFMVMISITVVCIFPVLVKDVMRWLRMRRQIAVVDPMGFTGEDSNVTAYR